MIKIGICGFGTVGQSLVKHLSDHKDLIANKTSLEFEIAYIADRSIHKKTYPKNINITTDVMDLACPGKVDILVELIGDVKLTYPLIKNAINNKIHIITANKALLAEVPRLDTRARRFAPIEGEIPSPIDPPSGCHFHPRCPNATLRCREERPVLREISPDRHSACHLNDDH